MLGTNQFLFEPEGPKILRKMEVLCGKRGPGDPMRVRGLMSALIEIGAPGPAAHRSDLSGVFFEQAERDGEPQKSGDGAGYLGLYGLRK